MTSTRTWTWGLCSGELEAWPDREDHLFPEQFPERLSPKYQANGQLCPLDRAEGDHPAWGCFYRCRLFSPERGAKRPDRDEAMKPMNNADRITVLERMLAILKDHPCQMADGLTDEVVKTGVSVLEWAWHACSSQHRNAILAAQTCGCFYCTATYEPGTIVEWCDKGETALCPECGIDAVLPLAADYPLKDEFLKAMRARWFKLVPVTLEDQLADIDPESA